LPFNFYIASNAFNDVDSNTLIYSAKLSDGSVLPSWITFNSNMRTFSGSAPSVATALNITVTVSDSYLTATQTFRLDNFHGTVLNGTAANNILVGTASNDIIYGLAGNDEITGGLGLDYIDGGTGIDNIYYNDSTAAITVNLLTNINLGGTAQGDTLVNIENIIGNGRISEYYSVTLKAVNDNAIQLRMVG
jgi:Ca2+-binding RTX toxin-like protein